MRRAILITVLISFGSILVAVPHAEAAADSSCSAGVSGDFNNDGYKDLAVGEPNGDIPGGAKNAGVVNVLYGSASGITSAGSQLWFQGHNTTAAAGDLAGTPETGDRFGSCLAAGDFNGDNKDDLAIGVFADNVNSASHAGAVNVIYGTTSGLASAHNQLWTQDSSGIGEAANNADHFGAALATGDFNGDGSSDLAIGVPNEVVGGNLHAGAVNVIYGSAARLTATGNQVWEQGTTASGTIQGHAEENDRFGSALVAGDFQGVGHDALAIGVPGEGVYRHNVDEGVVQVIFSNTTNGLKSQGNQLWLQDSKNIRERTENGDAFGSSLAAGDFNNDGFKDLAIGVPYEDLGTIADAGVVQVLFGSATRLVASNNQLWSQNTATMQDTVETADRFGSALSSADFNGDGFADLAIGVPGENASATDDGGLNIIYGSSTGLNDATVPNQFWKQGASSAGDTGENGDGFGSALATGDYNHDTFADIAIGIPGEGHGLAAEGAIIVLDGSASGITATGKKDIDQDSPGIPGSTEVGGRWGSALG